MRDDRIRSVPLAFANLHTHTFFSDGLSSPFELLSVAFRQKDMTCFALTDHDTMSGVEPVFRLLRKYKSNARARFVQFIPGVELSLREEQTGAVAHLVGLFPHITLENYPDALFSVEAVLGHYCRMRCLQRFERDVDERMMRAFALNLEGLRQRYASGEEIITLLRKKAEEKNRRKRLETEKEGDVIQHPIPVTYQIIIDHWEDLFPGSSKEKAHLYLLRPDGKKVDELARIYMAEGQDAERAAEMAERNLSVLAKWDRPAPYAGILEGLDLLKRAGAVTILAHPAADHERVSPDDFDHHVTLPLIAAGLDGIEVYYPYGPSLLKGFTERYRRICEKYELLVSGGTDFHGDGRAGMADVRLPLEEAERIVAAGLGKH